MTTERATVVVVDDDASVRRALSRMIRAMGFEAETYPSAEEFLRRGTIEGNACVVLDLRMPGMSGLELQRELAGHEYTAPIVFLTGHGDVPASVEAMKLGAVDFLQKPVEEADLERAIRAALDRDRELRRVYDRAREVAARIATLTPREREVMDHVVDGAPNKQIAGRLGIAEKTVKVHRSRVMQKMRVSSVPELVRAHALAAAGPPHR